MARSSWTAALLCLALLPLALAQASPPLPLFGGAYQYRYIIANDTTSGSDPRGVVPPSSCVAPNLYTGDCSCPATFSETCADTIIYDSQGKHTLMRLCFCDRAWLGNASVFAGFFQQDNDGGTCGTQCWVSNRFTGQCQCPSGYQSLVVPVMRLSQSCGQNTIPSPVTLCVSPDNYRPSGSISVNGSSGVRVVDTFSGGYVSDVNVTQCLVNNTLPVRPSRYRSLTNTSGCNCPVNSCGSQYQALMDGRLSTLTLCMTSLYQPVNVTTVHNQLLFGYQQWHSTPRNGYGIGYNHYTRDGGIVTVNGSNAVFDVWPDTSEYASGVLVSTPAQLPLSGANTTIYDAYMPQTTELHVQWQRHYGISGVWLQRFMTTLGDPRFYKARTNGLVNLMNMSVKYGRGFALMYDASGMTANNLLPLLQQDVAALESLGIFNSSAYFQYSAKPIIALWGCGVRSELTLAACLSANQYLHSRGYAVLGGVPFFWRTQLGASGENMTAYYVTNDIVSPWAVGVYHSTANYLSFAYKQQQLDQAYCDDLRIGYAPVVFPGFSWTNLQGPTSPLNQIPRNGGEFWQSQAQHTQSLKPTFVYGAMFDEIDEGTAMYKAAESYLDKPADGKWVSWDQDGYLLSNDHYLCLAHRQQNAMAKPVIACPAGTLGDDCSAIAVKEIMGDGGNGAERFTVSGTACLGAILSVLALLL